MWQEIAEMNVRSCAVGGDNLHPLSTAGKLQVYELVARAID